MTSLINLKNFCNLLNNSFFIHVNESTYLSNKSHSGAFVSFIDGNEIQEKFSTAKSCPKQAMAKIYSMFGLPSW